MTESAASPDAERAPTIDTTVPHQARVWNYLLGGKDNYLVDEQAGKAILAAAPGLVAMARASRVFLTRAVRYEVEQAGIRQFLDIGTGLPTANNTHEIAQSSAPESRIVYVDFDPLVLVHARALLASDPQGATDYIDADLRDTDTILREAHRTLDFTRPIGIILLGVLGAIESYDEARAIVRTLLDAVPAGSYLLVGDGTNTSEAMVQATRVRNQSVKPPYIVRSPDQLAGFLDGLEIVEPGVVSFPHWRPEAGAGSSELPAHVDGYGGIAYKR
ncbi:SAM-dependent methyltransferase [Plantactinospora sp. WMMC1484]|uniref:SAM-dependent methyltransferase n=1 Tax=Plantactinospora sp. WMMC1484 TaxID=3404122 RepID=UPI003BF5B826